MPRLELAVNGACHLQGSLKSTTAEITWKCISLSNINIFSKNYPRKLILIVSPKSFNQSDFDNFCLFMSKSTKIFNCVQVLGTRSQYSMCSQLLVFQWVTINCFCMLEKLWRKCKEYLWEDLNNWVFPFYFKNNC